MMNRTGLLIALALAAAIGVLFGIYPQLDLDLIRPFFDPAVSGFWGSINPWLNGLRDLSRLLVTLLVAPAAFAIVGKLVLPRRPMLIPGRAAVFLVVTLALGPGLLTNIVLKSHWGRPRPVDVIEFGGDQHFVPWWDPRGDCPTNCSFVAGEPSGAFWMLAPAVLVPPAGRALAIAAALAFGSGIGLVRMGGGGHFFTDVAFSGLFTFIIIWLVYGLLFRWPGTTDRAIERALEWLVLPLRSVMLRRWRLRRPVPQAKPMGGPDAGGGGAANAAHDR
ncbi:MAG TPA: phosphatase PAP2 family protein [Xanthobacteraceae bacterium]|jgi:membrane-associated PAP2 superfamily phosphatase